MVASQTTNNNSILDREKLNGSNFLDWYRNLRIVLGNEKKLHHLEEALPEAPPATTTVVVRNAYTHRVVEQQKVAYLMLAEKKLFEIVKAFHACKQKEGQSFSTYVLKMKAYLDQMERLGYPMPLVLGVNLILTSFSKDYDQERYTQDPTILAIRQVQIQKPKSQARGKGKNKGKGKLGHWKRNFLLYLAELKKNKASMSGTSGIFTIELYSFLKSNSWIYDTGCGTRICNTIQELRGIRKLNKGALDLYVSNGNRAAIEAIRSFDLMLPSGMKRIRKPQHDGLLKSTDDESFDICVSYISGKMARKPFTHASERADDLLGIIHSDVCGHLEPRYALESAARILNMVPTKKVNETPYEIWHGKVPNLSYLKETMGYYFYYPPENKIFVARYTEFFENILISQEASGSTVDFDENQRQDAQPSENTSEHQPEDEHEDVEPQTDEHELEDHGEPTNYRASLSDPESDKWLEAMNTKMQSMKDNQVWNLVDLPPNCKTVGSKWLFKKKSDMDDSIHTYKVCLVAKGFTQIYGVDYEETFSPVAYIKAIRILIAIATFYDYEIWQMDVKTAFLNGRLKENVYMVQHERFDEEIKRYFTQNLDEPCVYMRVSGSIVVFLILYVDDILLMGNNIPMLQDVKSWLEKCFAMKDLGEAAYILGIKFYLDRSRRLIGLSQNAYIDKILKQFKMDASKHGILPMQPNVDLRKTQGPSTPAETGYVFVMNGGAVDWKISKQSTTAMSSTDVGYIAASEAVIEAIWIRKFIFGLGVVPSNDSVNTNNV
ncbi:retrotransposon protein, putative, ty1-copia subclass [Tanacetum coccineum]